MLPRLVIFILFLITNSIVLASDSPFKSNHFTEQIGRLNDVASGDLNGDGYIDLFIVSETYSHKVYFNNSETVFKPSKQSFGLARGSKVVLEDFDNDGDLDAWVGIDRDWATTLINDQIYLNDGEGKFILTEQNVSSLGYRQEVVTLTAGDIDNDGDIDIIRATDENSDRSFIYRNNGKGEFTEELQDIDFFIAALGDYDGDGYLDIWTIGVSLIIYLNDQTGNFDVNRIIESPFGEHINGVTNVVNMLVDDIDGDGDLDAQGFTRNAILFDINGQPYIFGPESRLPRYINKSDGTFDFQEVEQLPSTGNNSNGILLDLDNDSDLDLWALGDRGRSTAIYATEDNGYWDSNAKVNIDSELFRKGVTSADFDNDGDVDVITVGTNGNINIWLNELGFNFVKSEQAVLNKNSSTSWSLTSLDIDQDGFMDYATADEGGISTYIGDGRGNFKPAWFSSNKRYFEITTADFNGDGFSDFALVGRGTDANDIWINNQDATFSLSSQQFEIPADTSSYSSVSAADFDNDGDQDLLFTLSRQALEIWENDGKANFSLKQTLSGDYIDAQFVNMNEDEKVEILSVNNSGMELANYRVHQYDGENFNLNFLFNDVNFNEDLSRTWKIVTFDWDGDGDIDVLKAATLNTSLGQSRYILVNKGSQGFVREKVFFESPYTGLRIFGAGDFNNDGLIDFYGSSNIIMMNVGENHFEAIIPNEFLQLQKVMLSDIDDDGDIDAISASQTQGMQRYINTTIDQDFNGLWYNPAQNGHGLQIDEMYIQGKKQLFVAWYVYQNGEPVWLSGIGSVVGNIAEIDMIITEGSGFLPDFNTEDVARIPWGTVTIDMLDKSSLNVSWETALTGFSNGEMPMQRLTSIASVNSNISGIRSCHSGSWYNTSQSGHGMMVEVIESDETKQMVMTWFTYLNGQQFWIVAQGDIVGDKAVLVARSARGGNFPPGFNSDDVEFDDWGEITFKLIDDTSASISWVPTNDDFSVGELEVSKLTFIDRYHCD